MSARAYRETSFLDHRALPFATDGFVMPHDHLVGWTHAIAEAPKPIQFIFHVSHVGSTLVSRLLDQAPGVLGLREPPTLRALALSHDKLGQPDALLSPSDYEAWFATHVRLWRRGYEDTNSVVLKATSHTARVGHKLMNDVPEARALLLNVAPETHLAWALSARDVGNLETQLPERRARLTRMLGGYEDVRSEANAVALSWLAETLTQQRIAHPWPHRTLSVDFDALLGDPGIHLSAIFHHFQIEMPEALRADRLPAHPLMAQYAKAPGSAYSAADRAERLVRSRRDNAPEISDGMAWLERTARTYPQAAEALAA